MIKKIKTTVKTIRFQGDPSTLKNNFGKRFIVFTFERKEINDTELEMATIKYIPGMRNKHLISVNGYIEETLEEGSRVELSYKLENVTYEEKYKMYSIKSTSIKKLNEITPEGFLRFLKLQYKGMGLATSTKVFNYLVEKYTEEESSRFLELFYEEINSYKIPEKGKIRKKDEIHELEKVLGNKKIISLKEQISKKDEDKKDIITLNTEELQFSANYNINPNFLLRLKKQIVNLITRKNKIYKEHSALPYLKKTPYLLAMDSSIKGFGFKAIDSKVFQFLSKDEWNTMEFKRQRMLGYLKYMLIKKQESGHLYLTLEQIQDEYFLYNEDDKEDKEFEIYEDIKYFKDDLLELINSLDEEINPFLFYEDNIYLKENFKTELQLARRLSYVNENFPINLENLNPLKLKKELLILQEQENIQLSDEQKEAVMNAIGSKVSIITGGPGTGKTTISNMIIKILQRSGKTIKLLAPTGTAAKRIASVSKINATTIHRGLEFKGKFTRNFDNPITEDVVICDESSMIDVFLGLALSEGCRKSQFIFLGDVNQLPSVGAGDFLRDLILSKKFNISLLTNIFRQAGDSHIIQFAYKVLHGSDLPEFFQWFSKKDTLKPEMMILAKDEFKKTINQVENPEYLNNMVNSTIEYGLKSYLIKSDDFFETQILVSNNRSNNKINLRLQEELNPNGEKIPYKNQIKNSIFRVGDKIIQNKNNYKLNVFNGSIGIIKEYNEKKESVLIHYFGDNDLMEIPIETLNKESKLCYSMTIHKSQGQEFKRTIMLINDYLLNSRELIYTGATRAKKNLVVITNSLLLTMGINNTTQENGKASRNTSLLHFLSMSNENREEIWKKHFQKKEEKIDYEEIIFD